jgi:hypothetical protein
VDRAFDLVEAINERIAEHEQRLGCRPRSVAVSPTAYRRLVEIKSSEDRIGNLIIGCAPIKEYATEDGVVDLVIDELLADTAVDVE